VERAGRRRALARNTGPRIPLRALHDLSISLARHADVVAFSRALTAGRRPDDRLGRVAAIFTFVCHLVDVPEPAGAAPRDGVDVLLRLAGGEQGPAVILASLLRAQGERVSLDAGGPATLVRVEIETRDVGRLPPHADPFQAGGRLYLPLDPRGARSALGLLNPSFRAALGGRGCRPLPPTRAAAGWPAGPAPPRRLRAPGEAWAAVPGRGREGA
jgi:hypothetical protein